MSGTPVARAEPDELAGGEDDLAAEHVRRGEAVLEAVRAAGVFGEVAADGADDLRRGIGRVEEACAADEVGDLRVGDAGLDGDEGVFEVDGEHAVHAREADDDAAGCGKRASAEAGAGAACDEGDVVLCADADCGLDLCGCAREDDGAGDGAEVGEAVALVGLELGGIEDEICIADGCSEFSDDLRGDHRFMVSRWV